MLLRLLIRKGAREGDELVIRDEVTLGRSRGDFALNDRKASSLHARIFATATGEVFIEDLDSTNGTAVNGVKSKISPLVIGDMITIGHTELEVMAAPSEEAKSMAEKGSWQELVEFEMQDCLELIAKAESPVVQWGPFKAPVRLEFVQGLQTGTKMTFGFGPREVGRLCPDGLLYEVHAPDVAFQLLPLDDEWCELRTTTQIIFVNDEKLKPVRNKKSIFAQRLKNGDRISFGQTVIVVTAV